MLLARMLRDLLSKHTDDTGPVLSVIVNFYNNRREAQNTLYSLSRQYQREATDIPYEVVVLDHGSSEPLISDDVRAFGPEFTYRFITTQSVSPVQAINEACRDAIGEQLLVIIDGAHILTPRILRLVRDVFREFPSPFVATVPFHLGPTIQNESIQNGYNQDAEDRLLDTCGWKENGYRLYSITGSYADDSGGWYGQLFESGCFAMRKADYLASGGFDEQFQSRGGGLTNLDFFQRALSSPELSYVVLLGEGTFHQVHGGVASNALPHEHPWNVFHREYLRIRGHPFVRVPRRPLLRGEVPKEAAAIADLSRRVGAQIWQMAPGMNTPDGMHSHENRSRASG